jgi:hypothetical protein
MTDANKVTATDSASQDFSQMQSTINNFENQKITSDQAQQALQQEWSKVMTDGVDNMVLQRFKDLENSKGALVGFPDLSFTTDANQKTGSFEQNEKTPSDRRRVDIDLNTGAVQVSSDSATSAQMAKNEALARQFVDPISNTAQQFFTGKADAQSTTAKISDEVKSAEAAGFDFNSAQFAAIVQNPSGGGLHYMALPGGKVGISDSDSGAVEKRIEFDTKNGAATAEDLHLSAHLYASSVAKYSIVGGGSGAVLGNLPGALLGAGAGAVAGLASGFMKSDAIDQKLAQYPGLIFEQ